MWDLRWSSKLIGKAENEILRIIKEIHTIKHAHNQK